VTPLGTDAPARQILEFFDLLSSDSWNELGQLALLAYTIGVLVDMAGDETERARLCILELNIEVNIAIRVMRSRRRAR